MTTAAQRLAQNQYGNPTTVARDVALATLAMLLGTPPNALVMLAGAKGWYDAGNALATVALWPDQSGNGNDLTQAAAPLQPTLNAGGQGGRSYFHFSGAQVFVNAPLAVPAGWTIWCVGRTSAVGGNQFAVVAGGAGGANLGLSGAGGTTNDIGTYVGVWLDSGLTATTVKCVAGRGTGAGPAGQYSWRAEGTVKLPIASVGGPYPGVPGLFVGASDAVAGNPLTGDLYEVAVFDRPLTDLELAALDAYAQAKYQLAPVTNLLVADGNSFVAGTGASGPGFYLGQQTLGLLGTGFGTTYVNNGVGAETTPAMLVYSQANTFPLYSAGIVPKCVDLACEITNDLYFGATAAQAYANTATYCQASRAAGFLPIINTVLPRSNPGTPADFEANRQIVNTALVSSWPEIGAAGLADWASDPRMGPAGSETNLSWFVAGNVHPNDVGYAIGAGYFAAAILQAIA